MRTLVNRFFVLIVAKAILFLILYLILDNKQEPLKLDRDFFSKNKLTSVDLENGFTHYQYLKKDSSTITVVFIHGAGSGFYAWDNNFKSIYDSGFSVLRYDLYGRGFSERPFVDYDTTLFYNQLKGLLDSLEINHEIHLVGLSMGSTVALHFANQHPDKVVGIHLVDPASIALNQLPFYVRNEFLGQLMLTFYWQPRAIEKQMDEFFNKAKVSEYRLKSKPQFQYKGLKRAMLSSWRNMLPLDMSWHLSKLYSRKIPLYLYWGKNDPLVPYQTSEHYLKAYPTAPLQLINEAGHLSNYENPTEFNTLLYSNLNKSVSQVEF